MRQKDTGVEPTYGKAQRVTATCQIDRRPRQDCGDSLDASDRPSWKSIGEAFVQQWTAIGWYDDDDSESKVELVYLRGGERNRREKLGV